MEKNYVYCSVLPRGIGRTYLYIFNGDHIEKGDRVLIPFGVNNDIGVGTVMEVTVYAESEVPYPVERTKEIMRVLSDEEIMTLRRAEEGLNDEFENDPELVYIDDEEQAAVAELDEHIKNGDMSEILDWVFDHEYMHESNFIMENVMRAYIICIKNNYRIDICALNLGAMYYSGVFVKRDYKKAAALYEMAADEGSVRAICNLGYCFYYGRHQERDYAKAYEYFNMGALLNDSNSLYKLGDMYMRGVYVKKNEKYAYLLYERADDAVEPWEEIKPDIKMRLGNCLLHGIGTEQDLDEALKKLCKALRGLYERRFTDPFVPGIIEHCRDLIRECEDKMSEDFVRTK